MSEPDSHSFAVGIEEGQLSGGAQGLNRFPGLVICGISTVTRFSPLRDTVASVKPLSVRR